MLELADANLGAEERAGIVSSQPAAQRPFAANQDRTTWLEEASTPLGKVTSDAPSAASASSAESKGSTQAPKMAPKPAQVGAFWPCL